MIKTPPIDLCVHCEILWAIGWTHWKPLPHVLSFKIFLKPQGEECELPVTTVKLHRRIKLRLFDSLISGRVSPRCWPTTEKYRNMSNLPVSYPVWCLVKHIKICELQISAANLHWVERAHQKAKMKWDVWDWMTQSLSEWRSKTWWLSLQVYIGHAEWRSSSKCCSSFWFQIETWRLETIRWHFKYTCSTHCAKAVLVSLCFPESTDVNISGKHEMRCNARWADLFRVPGFEDLTQELWDASLQPLLA